MDYEKLHRDTINNLQQMVNSGKITAEIARDICADFIPESEDERIRKEIITYLSTVEDKELIPYEPWIAWLKKQGESDIEEPDFFDDFRRTDSEVEPKFHEGDWVVKGDVIAQILDVQEQYYVGLDTEGKDFTASRFLSNDKIHLWTIQDAKDGDVLAFKNNIGGIIICKSHTYYDTRSYCRLMRGNLINKEESGWDSTLLIPATKEQRDILFQKMKEAGYEWDTDKKELKKIEQKTAIIIPKFKVGDKVYAIKDGFECTIESIDETCYYGDTTNFDIKDQDNWELVEQKPVWSEDDEQYLLVCKNALAKYQKTDKWDASIISQWLEFLKDRVQPKQEWSEEDESYLNTTIAYLKDAKEFKKTAENCINWLKSLRPQNTWKPSDEQMKILNEVLNFAANHESPHWNDYIFGTLNNLIRQLKKLREE